MMEKLAQAGDGGGCTPTRFHYIYHHKVVVYALGERAETLPLFLLCPYMYSMRPRAGSRQLFSRVTKGTVSRELWNLQTFIQSQLLARLFAIYIGIRHQGVKGRKLWWQNSFRRYKLIQMRNCWESCMRKKVCLVIVETLEILRNGWGGCMRKEGLI
jgi:hypothetical protein